MKRLRIVLAVCLVAAGAVVLVVANLRDPESLPVAGDRYAVTVLLADPVEVRVTKGDADTVTLAAAMPEMGHALPQVTTREVEPGRFVAQGRPFDMDGGWELTITLTGPTGRESLTTTALVS